MLDRGSDWLRLLIADIGSICRTANDDGTAVTRVAKRLAECGTDCRLPDRYRATKEGGYTQHLVHVSEDRRFSVVALAWRPGQQTPIHDHLGWCAVAVCEGAECETRYRLCNDESGPYLVEVSSLVLRPGETVALVPDGSDVHRVSNCNAALTVSLHVYGVDIGSTGSSISSCFDAMTIRAPGGAALAPLVP